MTIEGIPRSKSRREAIGGAAPVAALVVLLLAVGGVVVYMLWPSWPNSAVPLDAPAIPVTVAGVVFQVPPGAIRVKAQRQPGTRERIDLVFAWSALSPQPPTGSGKAAPEAAVETLAVDGSVTAEEDAAETARRRAADRLFVTISGQGARFVAGRAYAGTGAGAVLAPSERLRTIYPRYVEEQATAGPEGLAILPFRAGTPYASEDLIFLAEQPAKFFARCTRAARTIPGICIAERALDAAEITLRFPRVWLDDWQTFAAGVDRLMAQLHPG